MPYITLTNAEMFYEDVGFGEPILFLHSHFNRGILAFACQMQAFHKIHRCLLPDFRGHGRTKSSDLNWSIPKCVEDMVCFLDALHIEKAHLVGYGGGGVTGFHLALKYPGRFASLVSIGFSGLPYYVDLGEKWLAEGLLRDGRYDIINEINKKHFDAHGGNWQEFMERTQIDDRSYNDLGEDNIRSLQLPVLLIAGEHDPYSTPEQHRKMQLLLPSIEVMECKGGDHRPHMVGEHTQSINRAILSFLKKHAFQERIDGILPVS